MMIQAAATLDTSEPLNTQDNTVRVLLADSCLATCGNVLPRIPNHLRDYRKVDQVPWKWGASVASFPICTLAGNEQIKHMNHTFRSNANNSLIRFLLEVCCVAFILIYQRWSVWHKLSNHNSSPQVFAIYSRKSCRKSPCLRNREPPRISAQL